MSQFRIKEFIFDAGVEKYIDEIKSELIQPMILTGCNDITSVDEAILFDEST